MSIFGRQIVEETETAAQDALQTQTNLQSAAQASQKPVGLFAPTAPSALSPQKASVFSDISSSLESGEISPLRTAVMGGVGGLLGGLAPAESAGARALRSLYGIGIGGATDLGVQFGEKKLKELGVPSAVTEIAGFLTEGMLVPRIIKATQVAGSAEKLFMNQLTKEDNLFKQSRVVDKMLDDALSIDPAVSENGRRALESLVPEYKRGLGTIAESLKYKAATPFFSPEGVLNKESEPLLLKLRQMMFDASNITEDIAGKYSLAKNKLEQTYKNFNDEDWKNVGRLMHSTINIDGTVDTNALAKLENRLGKIKPDVLDAAIQWRINIDTPMWEELSNKAVKLKYGKELVKVPQLNKHFPLTATDQSIYIKNEVSKILAEQAKLLKEEGSGLSGNRRLSYNKAKEIVKANLENQAEFNPNFFDPYEQVKSGQPSVHQELIAQAEKLAKEKQIPFEQALKNVQSEATYRMHTTKSGFWMKRKTHPDINDESIEWDPRKAYTVYIKSSADNIGRNAAYGPGFNKLQKLGEFASQDAYTLPIGDKLVRTALPSKNKSAYINNLVHEIQDAKYTVDPAVAHTLSTIRLINSTLKLPFSGVANLTQSHLVMAEDGVFNWAKSLAGAVKDPQAAKDYIRRNGHWASKEIDALYDMIGQHGHRGLKKVSNIVLTPFSFTEHFNRISDNLVAKNKLDIIVNGIKTGQVQNISMRDMAAFREAGINLKGIVDGTVQLTDSHYANFANVMERRRQFGASRLDIPLLWNHPLVKTALQFKNFSFGYSKALKNMLVDGIDSWMKAGSTVGTDRLTRLATLMPMFGYAYGKALDLIYNNPDTDREGIDRILQAAVLAGGLGIATDVMNVFTDYNGLGKFAAGPTSSLFNAGYKGSKAVVDLAIGKKDLSDLPMSALEVGAELTTPLKSVYNRTDVGEGKRARSKTRTEKEYYRSLVHKVLNEK